MTVTPFVDDGDVRILLGDCREVLATLPAESVDCVATSPPFFGLRDYQTGAWEGGDEGCDHAVRPSVKTASSTLEGGKATTGHQREGYKEECGKCGARRVDRQIGLEATPEEWAAELVAVFRECRRVLRPAGSLWIECGDSYAGSNGGNAKSDEAFARLQGDVTKPVADGGVRPTARQVSGFRGPPAGLKQKDLIGQPFLLAFALRADGWNWRGSYVWSKKNAMPESATDRCTTAHSTILHFSKCRWTGPKPGRFADLSEIDKRWLAAMVDTEGCVLVRHGRNQGVNGMFAAQVTFTNTNQALLDNFRRTLGDNGSVVVKPTSSGRRPCFSISVGHQMARDLLLAIYPFMLAKREQARLAIYAQGLLYHRGNARTRTPAEQALLERCWQTSKALNQGEDIDLGWVPEPRYGQWRPQPYFFDGDAIAEPAAWERWGDQTVPKYEGTATATGWMQPKTKEELVAEYARAKGRGNGNTYKSHGDRSTPFQGVETRVDGMKHPRSVWTIPTRGFPGAHFATWPEALAARIIKAGCPEWVCSVCGKARERIVKKTLGREPRITPSFANHHGQGRDGRDGSRAWIESVETVGWSDCGHGNYQPGVILDPFGGSGTTAVVARRLGRRAILIELNEDYARMAAERVANWWKAPVREREPDPAQMSMLAIPESAG